MCLMEKSPAIKPYNYQGHEASITELTDKLSGLPHDVLLLILSYFTAKEVARIRLVSKRWRMWLLRYFPKLNFENPTVMKRLRGMYYDEVEFVSQERSAFVRCVDDALKEHSEASIDQLRVKFDLDETCQSNIDTWVAFAFAKRVKRLELDFEHGWLYGRLEDVFHRYSLQLECCKLVSANHALTCLRLKSVNITSKVD